jgi:hypothetical protein
VTAFPGHFLDHRRQQVANLTITGAGQMSAGSPLIQADEAGDVRCCIDTRHVQGWRYEIGEGVLWLYFADRWMRFTSADPDDRFGPTNDLDEALYQAMHPGPHPVIGVTP